MLGYLSADTICSEEQTMSPDKYPSISSRKMEAIVFTILQIVFETRGVLKIGEYLTNKEASTVLCSVVKHAGSDRA